jgi:hypothetical protein
VKWGVEFEGELHAGRKRAGEHKMKERFARMDGVREGHGGSRGRVVEVVEGDVEVVHPGVKEGLVSGVVKVRLLVTSRQRDSRGERHDGEPQPGGPYVLRDEERERRLDEAPNHKERRGKGRVDLDGSTHSEDGSERCAMTREDIVKERLQVGRKKFQNGSCRLLIPSNKLCLKLLPVGGEEAIATAKGSQGTSRTKDFLVWASSLEQDKRSNIKSRGNSSTA